MSRLLACCSLPSRASARACAAALLVTLGMAAQAQAEPPPPAPRTAPAAPGAAPPPDAPAPAEHDVKLAQAKELFQKGNELRKIGDCQRALEFYLGSRQLVASVPNTINAAFCLDQLGRVDESLELYEVLLTEFRTELGEEERKGIAATASALRTRVGNLSVSSNVDGMVLLDGRTRGRLPLQGPIRVRSGDHTLRVVKDGWSTFERVVTVRIGETISIDAKLEPLASTGRLRIDDERLVGADLYIDGTLIGQLPWEGTLAPGSHFYSVRRGDLGSAPREANVVAGQTVAATVEAGPLAPEVRIVVQPLTAELAINGVPVGKGQWRGALPLGRHTIEAHEEGYFPRTIRPTIDRSTTGDIPLMLTIDENHPRWGRKVGVFWLEAFGGYAFASSLDSGAERACDRGQCSDRSTPSGALAGLRGGYEFPIGAAIEITAGYLTLSTAFQRTLTTTFPDPRSETEKLPITYQLRDDINLSGVTVAVGGSYRYGLTSWLGVGAAAHVGAVLAATSDAVGGSATSGESAAPVGIAFAGETLRSAAPFVMPELRLKLQLGKVTAGAAMGVGFFLIDGPPHETGDTYIIGADCDRAAPTVGCAPPKKVVFEERSHGTFAMLFPSLSVGYKF